MAGAVHPRIGIALGSGSARGWAHIGVLQALAREGVRPDVVCGTSIGALVGAAYASDRLEALEEWVLGLDWWGVLGLMDMGIGGVGGERLMRAFFERVPDVPIERLPRRYGAVATDLASGREVWFQDGPLQPAVRASLALPGLFAPARRDGRWLVDGGLVDPVPVSLCRALGAELVIAVNLNGDIVGRHLVRRRVSRVNALLDQMSSRLQQVLGGADEAPRQRRGEEDAPGLFDVMASAMNIMQDRITRSRMAGDPPDIILAPRLAHLALMDFDHAAEAIEAGVECVERHLFLLRDILPAFGEREA